MAASNGITIAFQDSPQPIPEFPTRARHEIGTPSITPYRSVLSNKTLTSINVTVQNQGDAQETFNVARDGRVDMKDVSKVAAAFLVSPNSPK